MGIRDDHVHQSVRRHRVFPRERLVDPCRRHAVAAIQEVIGTVDESKMRSIQWLARAWLGVWLWMCGCWLRIRRLETEPTGPLDGPQQDLKQVKRPAGLEAVRVRRNTTHGVKADGASDQGFVPLATKIGPGLGDFERFIVAPRDALDAFNTIPELFNLCDRYQCPGIAITDLLISEGTFSVDPDDINLQPEIDRGELITDGAANGGYLRYEDTESGVSPRAIPGVEGFVHVVATDEHDQDGVLISDEFTNPLKRRQMVEKRARKFAHVVDDIAPPELEGPADADVTLIGWGSTAGVIKDAIALLEEQGVSANQLAVKWIVPLHGDAIIDVVDNAKRTIIVENNHSGQFYRYLRSATGLTIDGHIRKYDGEPFMPHHIVDAVMEQLAGKTDLSVPVQEIMV